jgi:hypothetical protein
VHLLERKEFILIEMHGKTTIKMEGIHLLFFQTSSFRQTVHIIDQYYCFESILPDRFLPRRLNIIAQYFIFFVGYNAQTCLRDTATAGVAIAVAPS